MIQITNEEIHAVYQFLHRSIYIYKHHLTPVDHKRIIITMPNFLIYYLRNHPMFEYSPNARKPINNLNEYLFEGVKIQPHYANEIVVFFEDYHFNPERFKPLTHIIKNEV